MNWRISEPSSPRRSASRCTSRLLEPRPELGLGGEVRVGDGLLLGGQRVPQRPRAGEPQPRRDLERVVEAGVDRLDDGAGRERGPAPRRRRPRRPRGAHPRSRASASRRRAARRCRRPARRRSRRPSGGSEVQSRASGCSSTFSISAASATLIVCGPRCATVPNGDSGYAGTRPKLGLSPTLPQNAAGMRTEPAPSVPTPSGPSPAATAAAAPPDEPPGVLSGSTGCA